MNLDISLNWCSLSFIFIWFALYAVIKNIIVIVYNRTQKTDLNLDDSEGEEKKTLKKNYINKNSVNVIHDFSVYR